MSYMVSHASARKARNRVYWFSSADRKHSNSDCIPVQYPLLFEGLGKLEAEYKIELMEGAKPYALTTPRRITISLLPQVKAELERMEAMGVFTTQVHGYRVVGHMFCLNMRWTYVQHCSRGVRTIKCMSNISVLI